MKTKILIFTLAILFLFGTVGEAVDFSIYGGTDLATFEIPNIQNKISDNNHILELAENEGHETDEMKLNYLPGFNVGVEVGLSEKLSFDSQYERIFASRSWKMKHQDTGYTFKENWDITLNGINGMAKYDIFEFLALQGGLGYYFGEQQIKREDENTMNYNIDFEGSIGYLIGGQFKFAFTDNLNLVSDIKYRILNMKINDRDNYYSDNFDEDTFDGLDLQMGVKYNF